MAQATGWVESDLAGGSFIIAQVRNSVKFHQVADCRESQAGWQASALTTYRRHKLLAQFRQGECGSCRPIRELVVANA